MVDLKALTRMKLVTKFETFVNAIITTINMKTSVRMYTMIKALVKTINNTKQMKTYLSVYDKILPEISEFCLPHSVFVHLENPLLKVLK